MLALQDAQLRAEQQYFQILAAISAAAAKEAVE